MKQFALLALIACSLPLVPTARAEEPAVVTEYEVLANSLMESVNVAQTREEITAIQNGARDLIHLGWQVMDYYGAEFPECAVQFEEMKAQLPGSENMPIPQLREKFHNAVGLSPAPKYCYFGRAMAYYPFVSIIRLNFDLDEPTRKKVVHHFFEAVEHVNDIREKVAGKAQAN